MFCFGDYTLESSEHRLRLGPREILLRPKVFDMLLYFVEHRGRLVTKEEMLNADVVLEGSVRRSGDRIRIAVQLLHSNSGYHVWSEQYDSRMGDIFALQADIAAGN